MSNRQTSGFLLNMLQRPKNVYLFIREMMTCPCRVYNKLLSLS